METPPARWDANSRCQFEKLQMFEYDLLLEAASSVWEDSGETPPARWGANTA